jgi:BolA family transcriptional regulator, general stress-responsive regulator
MGSSTSNSPIRVTAAHIEAQLRAEFSPLALEVIDESGLHAGHVGANGTGFGTHFKVNITSNKFQGMSKVQSHRLVYDSLRTFFDLGLHALALQTKSPL